MQTRDVVYEEIQNIRLRNHDYVPSYTEYVLNPRLRNRPEHGVELSSVLMDLRSHAPILLNTDFNDGRPSTICIQEINQENEESALYPNDTSITGDMNDQRMAILAGNQNENNDAGSEIYFDVANTQGNGISNVNGYEEPAVKTRNSYIVILPNVTDLEGVSEDHCDSIASYENNEPGKGEDMDSEFSLNLAKYMGENCNSRSHPIGKDSLDGNKIQVLQSDYDASDDERESAEYIKPLRVRPHSYVTVLPMIEVHNADVCSSLDT
ncbi:uncharacterized protein LOC130053049 [Ostrea edulis]|uniref:uncharacterized protein LOC130053049 n=1 Tax=Ostrea edulis TaxID=37623 RepID=UPI0024AFD7C2|nr:uncharacterized protein LOC130053049 [Ostrea edulis]